MWEEARVTSFGNGIKSVFYSAPFHFNGPVSLNNEYMAVAQVKYCKEKLILFIFFVLKCIS
jgi:hypothetical protein